MPLSLLIGPANAEKARVVLDRYEAAARAGREPLLVVPTSADLDVYRREVAGRGLVFGAEVLTARFLERELARRAGVRGRALGSLARERVAVAAVEAVRPSLRALGVAAATAGFPRALLRLVDELQTRRITPARWYAAVRAWGTAEPARAPYAEDLGALYSAYRRELEAVGRSDATLLAVAALDALREEPRRWGDAPVLFYGFDDLTALQRDLVETLAVSVGADVTVSLPFEPGRVAFAAIAGTAAELSALSSSPPMVLESVGSGVLHHLERHLFEGRSPTGWGGGEAGAVGACDGAAACVHAAGSVVLLCGGGERAELELVGAHVARLLREGEAAEDVAIALRRPEVLAPLVEQVLAAYGVPFALTRTVRAGHTSLGGGLCALLRAALLDGTADDLLRYLRVPGMLRRPELADDLEAQARREGLRSAAAARAAWEAAGRFPLEVLDRCAAAHERGPAALFDWLSGEAGRLLAAPHAGRARVLDAPEAADAAVAASLRGALGELSGLARTLDRRRVAASGSGRTQTGHPSPLLPDPAALEALLSELPVRVGRRPGPGLVTVADPLALRARRVKHLFLAGLQEGVFPAPARPDPFLGDAERRALNTASGLRLALEPDRLAQERSLFYEAVSRPTQRLVLSWHDADEDGKPQTRSPFVDDVLDLVAPGPVQRRPLGAAGWEDAALAPTAREAARAAAAAAEQQADEHIAPLRDAAVLGPLARQEEWSASALETWVACPVKWFVERHLRPDELVPDPEPLVRGRLAHEVLEVALGDRLDPPRALRPTELPALRERTRRAVARLARDHVISPVPERAQAALRRLEVDLVAYLEWAAHAGSTFGPARLEVAFGSGQDLPAVTLGDLTLRGRIDRVDVSPDGRAALLYDYKGRTATPQARWVRDGKLQLALYLLALPHLLHVPVVGGLYQPLGNDEDPRPRGLIAEAEDAGLDTSRNDRLDPDAFARVLDEALAAAVRARDELRAGRLQPRPASCGWKDGGCTHPAICRAEGL